MNVLARGKRKFSTWLASAVAISLWIAAPVDAAEYTMKLTTPTINDIQHEWMKRYKERVEKASEGRIEVQLYPASQLGPINTVMEGMQLGTIEGAITPCEFYVGVDPRLQICAIPGLFESWEDARAKLDDPEVREYILNLPADEGIVGISLVIYGPQVISTRTPVKDLDDLRGKRLRVLASETEVGSIEALGASAVPMPLNEVSAALQQGAIDGVSTGLAIFVSLNTHDVAPHVVPTELWYLVSMASVSKVWLDSLPEDLQEIVVQTGKELEQELFEYQLEQNEANIATWQERGGTITPLPDDDQQTAEEAVAQVAAKFLENNPEMQEGYDLIQAAGSN